MRLIITVGLLVALLPGGLASIDASCSGASWVGDCEVSNPGDRVDIIGEQTNPGDYGKPGQRPGASPAPEPEECATVLCRPTYEVVGLPDVTIADLASFVPARPTLTGEPLGVGVVGMPANVIAAASEQRIAGELFDFDVVVRFVPSGFRFDYGDGTGRTTGTGGAAWSQLGQAEFTPTATSHVYRARGTYDASVTVLYAASVDFGNGFWKPVPGFVEATTGGYGVRIVEVHTALVDETCAENPSGPGC